MVDLTRRVREYYERVDTCDYGAMLLLFADDCVYERPNYDPMVGKQALAHFYDEERVIASGQHELDTILAEGGQVAVEGHFSGVLRDGSRTAVRFADFFRFADDLIVERHTYFYAPAV